MATRPWQRVTATIISAPLSRLLRERVDPVTGTNSAELLSSAGYLSGRSPGVAESMSQMTVPIENLPITVVPSEL